MRFTGTSRIKIRVRITVTPSRGRGFRKPFWRDGDEGEFVPVEPPKPNTLSGGAAAELEFDN